MWISGWESRTLKADLCSVAARQARAGRGDCWQRRAGCEKISADSDEPSGEVGVADAGSAGAAAAVFEVSPSANRSARPSRAPARPNRLLCLSTRLRLSLCQIRLGEHPPPQIYPQGQQPAVTRRDAALPSGRLSAASARFSLSCAHSSMSRGVCQVILKNFFAVLKSGWRLALK